MKWQPIGKIGSGNSPSNWKKFVDKFDTKKFRTFARKRIKVLKKRIKEDSIICNDLEKLLNKEQNLAMSTKFRNVKCKNLALTFDVL